MENWELKDGQAHPFLYFYHAHKDIFQQIVNKLAIKRIKLTGGKRRMLKLKRNAVKKNTEIGKAFSFFCILQGVLVSFLVLLLFYLIASIVVYFFSSLENNLEMITTVLGIISAGLGGGYVARKAKNKGWANGALVGGLFILITIIIGYILNPVLGSVTLMISRLAWGIVIGAVGGMIGVNFAK